MTNSFFEAANYADALRRSYQPINEQFERNERLERENDETRLKNAQMPLEVIKSLAEFAPTLKKAADEIAMGRYIKNSATEVPKDNEALGQVLEDLDKFEYLNDEMKTEALEEKNVTKYDAVATDGISQKKAKDIVFESDRLTWSSEVQKELNNYYASGADPVTANQFINSWWQNKKENLIAAGYNNSYIEFFGRKTFNQIKNGVLTDATEKSIKKRSQEQQLQFVQQVSNASKNLNSIDSLHQLAQKNKARHGGNLGDSYRDLGNALVELVKLKQLPYAVADSFFESIVEAKGDKPKALIEKLGGSVAADALVQGWREEISKARKDTLDAISTENQNYGKEYTFEFREQLYKDGNVPSKEELIEYIYQNPETKYDFSRGPLPTDVNNALSAEVQEDTILIPTIEKKANLGILTMADVMKINNSGIRSQYINQVKETGIGTSGTYSSIGKSAAGRIASTVTEETDGTKDRSIRWGNINDQVNLLYPSVYAKYLRTAQPEMKDGVEVKSAEMVAHGAAQEELLQRAQAGEFNTWGEFTSNTQSQLSAVEHIKSGGENQVEINNWLGNNIIVGTEKALKEAQSYPEGSTQTALMYKQIGEKIGVPGHILQLKQLEAAAILEGKDLPVKSAIALAYEKMSDKEKALLKKVTPARLARMKFEAYMNTPEGGEEGTITYDEMLALHPSVIALSKETEELNQQATAVQDTQPKPKKGDWKPLPKGTYVQFDGKDWKQVGFTFGGQAYEGDVDEYLDKDLVRQKF